MSQTVKGFIMQNLCDIVFYMNVNVLQNFHICNSVPLKFIFQKIKVTRFIFICFYEYDSILT